MTDNTEKTEKSDTLNVAGAIVAVGLIANLSFVTWALVFIAIPPENQNALTFLLGNLSTFVGMVVAFYYGSSITNKRQAETIDKQASTIQEAQSALAPINPVPAANLAPGESVVVKAQEEST